MSLMNFSVILTFWYHGKENIKKIPSLFNDMDTKKIIKKYYFACKKR